MTHAFPWLLLRTNRPPKLTAIARFASREHACIMFDALRRIDQRNVHNYLIQLDKATIAETPARTDAAEASTVEAKPSP